MKLVTFDAGRVGHLEDEVVVELNCASTREYFERGGQVGETGERLRLADVRLRAPIVPKRTGDVTLKNTFRWVASRR
jgi:hypothetical protein